MKITLTDAQKYKIEILRPSCLWHELIDNNIYIVHSWLW
jgi:hypothetical protein